MSLSSPRQIKYGLAVDTAAYGRTNYDVTATATAGRRNGTSCERKSYSQWTGTRLCVVMFRVVLVLTLFARHVTSAPTITFTDFNNLRSRRTFRDVQNPGGYYNTLFVDSKNSSRLFVGALDFVYALYASDIGQSYQKSENLTSHSNYSSTYYSSVQTCLSYSTANIPNKDVQCRNHARAIFSVNSTNEIYVCSTGAYKPQEYYLNNDLQVISVERRPTSGIQKCPFDPLSTYSAILVDNGNPYNFSSLYTGVATTINTGYVSLFRSPLYSDRYFPSPPALPLSTDVTDNNFLNTNNVYNKGVYVVSTFDIGDHVYYFFRELALESTGLCSPTFYSRVARVCKNDLGVARLFLTSRFTSFFKARLRCSVIESDSDIPFYFNDVYDVQYNATTQQFYALFMTNDNAQWGSAVCQYSLDAVNRVFNSGQWVEQTTSESAWLPTKPDSVPSPRPGMCIGSSLNYDTATASFIKSHPLLYDVISPTTDKHPSYYSKELAFQKLEVAYVDRFTIFYLYSPDLAELHRISVFTDTAGLTQFYELSIWQPFNSPSPVTVWNMLLYSVNEKSSLYLTTTKEVVQLDTVQCSTYYLCTDCVLDPYCGWSQTAATCMAYQPGFLQTSNKSQVLNVCQPMCTKKYTRTNVVPGMSLYLNCTSPCSTGGPITWYHQSNNSTQPVRVPVDTDNNYVLSKDNGLVILSVNRTQHVGRFLCQVDDSVVLTQHDVSLSVCNYGDNLRDVWLNEYVNYCQQFDDYLEQYSRWNSAHQNNCA